MVYAIWEVGLPPVPLLATEQRCRHLSVEELAYVPDDIRNVLTWLDSLAATLIRHRETPEYQTARRKSGVAHCQTGLTATELETRAAIRKAKAELRLARRLSVQRNNKELTVHSCHSWQLSLLMNYCSGSLQRKVDELTADGNADLKCRTPGVQWQHS